jgi:hypothetical protein
VRDLRAAGTAIVRLRDGREIRVAATEMTFGPERDRAIETTGRQPAPAGQLYRIAQRHVRAVGCFFRLDSVEPPSETLAKASDEPSPGWNETGAA